MVWRERLGGDGCTERSGWVDTRAGVSGQGQVADEQGDTDRQGGQKVGLPLLDGGHEDGETEDGGTEHL